MAVVGADKTSRERAVVSGSARILVVDDSQSIRQSLVKILQKEGYQALEAENGPAALKLLAQEETDLLLTDLKMPGMDGLELTHAAKKLKPGLEVIVFTAFGTVETAVEAMRQGAYHFVTKPIERTVFLKTVEMALEKRQLLNENQRLRQRLESVDHRSKLIGRSPAMRQVLEMIEQVAPSRATVLLQGESGTGKEVVAQALHDLSPRRDRPFIKVACAALPDTLLEAELFGYEKGAFTGAMQRKEGRFKLADGGTLLLDEIGEIALPMQVKLLRVLQESEFERIGGSQTLKVDVRIIAATNRDLTQEVNAKRFREDLYYRINVIQLNLPALRQKPEDVPLLADHFLRFYAEQNGKPHLELSRAALELLMQYSWPGNVRELENSIERAVVLARKPLIEPEDFPFQSKASVEAAPDAGGDRLTFAIGTPLEIVERRMMEETLRKTGGDREETARLLGISSRTIYRKLGVKTPAEPK